MFRSMLSVVSFVALTGCPASHLGRGLPPAPATPETAPVSRDDAWLDAELRACPSEPNPAACFDKFEAETSGEVGKLTVRLAKAEWQRDHPASEEPMAAPSGPVEGFVFNNGVYTSNPLTIEAFEECGSAIRYTGFDRRYGESAMISIERGGLPVPIAQRSAGGWRSSPTPVQTKDGRVIETYVVRSSQPLYLVWPQGESIEFEVVVYKDDPNTPDVIDFRETNRDAKYADWSDEGGRDRLFTMYSSKEF